MCELVDVTKTNMVQIVIEGARRLVSDVIVKKEPMTVEILLAIRNYLCVGYGSVRKHYQYIAQNVCLNDTVGCKILKHTIVSG